MGRKGELQLLFYNWKVETIVGGAKNEGGGM